MSKSGRTPEQDSLLKNWIENQVAVADIGDGEWGWHPKFAISTENNYLRFLLSELMYPNRNGMGAYKMARFEEKMLRDNGFDLKGYKVASVTQPKP